MANWWWFALGAPSPRCFYTVSWHGLVALSNYATLVSLKALTSFRALAGLFRALTALARALAGLAGAVTALARALIALAKV